MNGFSNSPVSISKKLHPWELNNRVIDDSTTSPTIINRVKDGIEGIIYNPTIIEIETFFND